MEDIKNRSTSEWMETFQKDLGSLGITPSMAKPEMEKEVERQRTFSQSGRVIQVRVSYRSRDTSKRGIGDQKQPMTVQLAIW